MCTHEPQCPSAGDIARAAAHVIASHLGTKIFLHHPLPEMTPVARPERQKPGA